MKMNLTFNDGDVIITLDRDNRTADRYRLLMISSFDKESLIDETYRSVDEAMTQFLKIIKNELVCYSPEPGKFEDLSI